MQPPRTDLPRRLDWVFALPENAGLLVAAEAPLAALRRHLRRFLKVQSPGGKPWLFRYYDPRILKAFLPVCSASEVQRFFGPIVAFGLIQSKDEVNFIRKAKVLDAVVEASLESPALLFDLRPEHLSALKRRADEAIAAELKEFINARCPEEVKGLSGNVMRQRILAGMQRARRYGFTRKSSLAFFVATMFNVGPEFDRQVTINTALTDAWYPPDVRIDMLMGRTTAADWEEAATTATPAAWNTVCANEDTGVAS